MCFAAMKIELQLCVQQKPTFIGINVNPIKTCRQKIPKAS